jgi:hypothetical protein
MSKPEHIPSPGFLQLLPLSVSPWSSIGIDFITDLPKFKGKDVIMVFVDRFTKFAHFLPLSHPYTVSIVSQYFFEKIYTLHGLPTSIITDRDPIFTTNFRR